MNPDFWIYLLTPNSDFLLHPDPDPGFYKKNLELKKTILIKNANISSDDLHKAVLWIRIRIRIRISLEIQIRIQIRNRIK
jgi:hypothetical protein